MLNPRNSKTGLHFVSGKFPTNIKEESEPEKYFIAEKPVKEELPTINEHLSNKYTEMKKKLDSEGILIFIFSKKQPSLYRETLHGDKSPLKQYSIQQLIGCQFKVNVTAMLCLAGLRYYSPL